MYDEMKSKVYKYCQDYVQTKSESGKDIPVLQLDKTTEEILRSTGPKNHRTIYYVKTGEMKLESNLPMQRHTISTGAKNPNQGSKL